MAQVFRETRARGVVAVALRPHGTGKPSRGRAQAGRVAARRQLGQIPSRRGQVPLVDEQALQVLRQRGHREAQGPRHPLARLHLDVHAQGRRGARHPLDLQLPRDGRVPAQDGQAPQRTRDRLHEGDAERDRHDPPVQERGRVRDALSQRGLRPHHTRGHGGRVARHSDALRTVARLLHRRVGLLRGRARGQVRRGSVRRPRGLRVQDEATAALVDAQRPVAQRSPTRGLHQSAHVAREGARRARHCPELHVESHR